MSRFESFIRFSPKLFVFAAVLDLVKQIQWLLVSWLKYHNEVFSGSDYGYHDGAYTADLIDRALDVFLYPLGWVATAIVVTLLLELYDRGRAPNA